MRAWPSANCRAFDRVVPALVRAGKRVVAPDLRGRGRSAVTPPGTYGWSNHAEDVLSVADHYGAATVDVVGHSMGGFIGLDLAAGHPQRCGRLVLLDAVGRPEESALAPIARSLGRLDRTYPSAADYLDVVRATNTAVTWDGFWESYYLWETVTLPAGDIGIRTSLMAVMEDASYGAGQDIYALWPKLSCPSLLLRAAKPMGEGGGFIVSAADAWRFADEVSQAVVTNVDANHYTIVADPVAVDNVVQFLSD